MQAPAVGQMPLLWLARFTDPLFLINCSNLYHAIVPALPVAYFFNFCMQFFRFFANKLTLLGL